MADTASPRPGKQPRRHNLRENTGKFTKATSARPAPSPHHGAVQSAYGAAQVAETSAFRPHRTPGATVRPAIEIDANPQGDG